MGGVFTTEKRPNIQLGIRLRTDLVEKFRALCEQERRNMNVQMEIILEEWFEMRKKRDSTNSSTKFGWVQTEKIKS